MPESAYGPTNQCIGLGKVLLDKGHTVVFAAEASWAGRLAPYGFVEDLVDLAAPDPDAGGGRRPDSSGSTSSTRRRRSSPSRRIEQLATFVQPTYQALIDGARYCEPQLRADHRPAPARRDRRGQRRLVPGADDRRGRRSCGSCRATRSRSAATTSPPVFSGYPADDRSGWADFLEEFDRTHAETWTAFDAWCREQGAPPLPPRDFMHTSPDREPLRLPARARLRRRPPARPDLAPDRLQRPRDRRAVRRACRASPTGRPAAGWSTCRSARSAAPTSP